MGRDSSRPPKVHSCLRHQSRLSSISFSHECHSLVLVTPMTVSGWNDFLIGKMVLVDVGARFISPAKRAWLGLIHLESTSLHPFAIPIIPTIETSGRDKSRPNVYTQLFSQLNPRRSRLGQSQRRSPYLYVFESLPIKIGSPLYRGGHPPAKKCYIHACGINPNDFPYRLCMNVIHS